MLLLVAFAFIAGVVTVLSPCILPLLPIILSSADGSKQKPLGVVTGFVASFTFFTLFLSSIVQLSGISANSLRFISIAVLAVFGLTLLIPAIQARLEILFSRFAGLAPTGNQQAGFWGGILIGLSLGLLWTPCVGPILASVISLALTGSVNAGAFFITLAYAIGTALPMLAIMIAGSTALQKVPWLLRNTANIQKAFGVLMILTAIGIYFNVERQFQAYILKTFPNYGTGLTQFEDNKLIQNQLEKFTQDPMDESMRGKPSSEMMEAEYPQAPEIIPGGEWFNSEPMTLESLRGKVVLIDFWTYSCINCQRTLPYLRDWWSTYQDDGLVIIGVHSPEFEFEKTPENVVEAIADFEIEYPVVQDNNFQTWRAYSNRYWPAKYLIDDEGKIRYTHFGEGKYDETEKMIQKLLNEAGSSVRERVSNQSYQLYSQTPELYLGSARIEYLASPESVSAGEPAEYSLPQNLPDNQFAYQGTWTIMPEYAQPESSAVLELAFEAKEVFLVARPIDPNSSATITVSVDEENQNVGPDVVDGIVTITKDALYHLVSLDEAGKHTLELEFNDSNVEIYAFTFG